MARLFARYIGIDYSGAQTAEQGLPGLRVYAALGDGLAQEVLPPAGPSKYWSRQRLAAWLTQRLDEEPPTLVGIDHAFSFPDAYFRRHGLPPNWDGFLDDFQQHWPTDGAHLYVDFVRDGLVGRADLRSGNRRWRRVTEQRAGSAKSVFHFDVQGQVAKSTHAGLPWLRRVRRKGGARVHFWPFDGWTPPAGRHVVAEVYPALWKQQFQPEDRTPDQHDAYSVARWMQEADAGGHLAEAFRPTLSSSEQHLAAHEGWILGVGAASAAQAQRRLTAAPVCTATLLVQRQLDAYNAKDLATLLACYAPEARVTDLQGQLLRQGQAALSAAFTDRFAEPDLHAELLHRHVLTQADGSVLVIDLERIRRNTPAAGHLEMLCAYTVHEGRIQHAACAAGRFEPLDGPPPAS